MKIKFLLLLLLPVLAFGQQYPVDTLLQNGSLDNRINVVLMGDGFTEEDMPKFRKAASDFVAYFIKSEPYSNYQNFFNFFAIETPSKESGVSNPGTAPDAYTNHPVIKVDNFFGSTFGTNIHRLAVIRDYNLMYSVLNNNFPQYDIIFMLLNSEFYGGSGGQIAAFTLHYQANPIGMHELGHSFGGLRDEYWAGTIYAREGPNMTAESNPERVRWKNWIGTKKVGVFPHGDLPENKNWYKPTNLSCIMENLSYPFCPVCVETSIENIYSVIHPIDEVYPNPQHMIEVYDDLTLGVKLIEPRPNTYKSTWKINGQEQNINLAELVVKPGDLNKGSNLVELHFYDETDLNRKDPKIHSVSWQLEKNMEVELIASREQICKGESIQLLAEGCSGEVVWSVKAQGEKISLQPETNSEYWFNCKINDDLNYKSNTVTIQVNELPKAQASNSGPHFVGEMVEFYASGGTKYSWTGPGGFSSNSQNPKIPMAELLHNGTYTVEITGANNCVSSTETTLTVDAILSNFEESLAIKVFPNPSNGIINIQLPGSELTKVQLFSTSGKLIKEQHFSNSEIEWNLSDIASGIYLLKAQNSRLNSTVKISIL